MRVYAEQTWGSWNGRANFDPTLDNIIVFAGQDIGLIGIRRCSDHWFLGKLYLLPTDEPAKLADRLCDAFLIRYDHRAEIFGIELR